MGSENKVQYTIPQLNQMLLPQGYQVVPFVSDQAVDVKMRPVPVDESVRSLNAAISGLARLTHQRRPADVQDKIIDVEDVIDFPQDDKDCSDLANLFRKCGSDKATTHNYHLLYAYILRSARYQVFSLLEIGIGTNNIDVLSNMGRFGTPGASLRAFRDWAPRASVIGADIDERILFREDRIETYPVDQTKPESLAALAARFTDGSLDLIIDDGLHLPEANINTLLFALPLLKEGGSFVVEDVHEDTFPFWQIAMAQLSPSFSGKFIKTQKACMVHVRRLG